MVCFYPQKIDYMLYSLTFVHILFLAVNKITFNKKGKYDLSDLPFRRKI